MSAPRSRLDLLCLHGLDEPVLHAHFPDLPEAGRFIRRYALNNNFGVERNKGTGCQKRWYCIDSNCTWSITLTEKRGSSATPNYSQRKKPKTKLSGVPEGSWYIGKLDLQHVQCCCSVPKFMLEDIVELPGFKAAIVEGHNTSKARVVNSIKQIDGFDLSAHSSLVYRAIRKAKASQKKDPIDEFGKLPSFLTQFAAKNTGSRVCLQLDSEGRFFRSFLSIGSAVQLQDSLLPVWECDGTHMKDPGYNGICLTLIGKDGEKKNVPVAVAYIHKETVDNFAWFFCNCVVAGLHLHDRPTFCDRGKQLGAEVLLAQLGLQVHLKFCSLHIRFNTMDRFKALKLNQERLNDDIFELQSTETADAYDAAIERLRKRYPTGIVKCVGDKVLEEHVHEYLRRIHPTDWCVVGNMQPTSAELSWLSESWGTVSKHGDPLPLFGVRTTSGIEGDNNGLLWTRVRENLVLSSMMAFCTRAVSVCQKRLNLLRKWHLAKFDVTPHAKKLLDEEKKHVAKQTVLPAKEPLFYVFDAFDERNVCGNTSVAEVDMDKGTCTRCMVSEQLQVPCRHIQAVIFSRSKLKDSPLPMYDTRHYFHQAYLVPKLYAAFSAVNIRLPLYDTLSMTSAVKPSPLYLQAGRQIQRSTEVADVSRASKRTKNRGEGTARSKRAASRLLQLCEVSNEDDADQEISEFFDEHVRSAITATRGDYTCTNCGNTGHNTRRCTTVTCEVEERGVGIVPGEYVVGESPFIACGIQDRYCVLIKNYR